MYEKEFLQYLDSAPKIYQDYFKKTIGALERPDYHPERYLEQHIRIVFNNAMNKGDKNLIMAALLHDICKPCTTRTRSVQLNDKVYEYNSNPYHDVQVFDFINDNEGIQRWIVQHNADIDIVKEICRLHMRFKNYNNGLKGKKGGMKLSKQLLFAEKNSKILPFLIEFEQCDNMVETKKNHPDWFHFQPIFITP